MDALLEAAFTDVDPKGFSEQRYMQWARAHPMALAFVDTVIVLHFLMQLLFDFLGLVPSHVQALLFRAHSTQQTLVGAN